MARNYTSTIDEKPVLATKKYRRVMSASTLTGDKVVNPGGETLGKIDEIMIDTISGRVAYAVLSAVTPKRNEAAAHLCVRKDV